MALVVPGCSGSSSGRSLATLVDRYVGFLNAGDFDAAMGVRCKSAQVDSSHKAQFLAEIERLKVDAGGGLEVNDVKELSPVDMATSKGALGEHELIVRLRLADGASSPVRWITMTEDGQPKLCGWSIDESFALRDELAKTVLTSSPVHIIDVKTMVSGAVQALGVKVFDAEEDTGHGAGVEGWTAAWRTGSFGGGRITAVRYKTPSLAVSHAIENLTNFAADASATFVVAQMPDARGLRYTGSAWTGVQPADLGPQIDLAVAVYDDVVISMTVSALDPSEDHSRLVGVVEAVLKFAHG